MAFDLPTRVHEIAVELGRRFPELRKGEDSQRRAYTMKVAQQARFELGGDWGTKRSAPGHPQSKDSVAQNGPRLIGWDLINGDTREVHPSPIQGSDITGQDFIPVEPVDHLGVRPGHQDAPPHLDVPQHGDVPPPVEVNQIVKKLDELIEKQEQQTEILRLAIQELKDQIKTGIKVKF